MVEAAKKPAKSYETYKKVKTLGTGSFGVAYLVECQSNKVTPAHYFSQSLAVIKQIDLTDMGEDERKETLREAKILEVLNHPNIVKFHEVYKTKKGKLCIVMDYADGKLPPLSLLSGGDLQSRIKERHQQKKQTGRLEYFSEEQVLNWFT